LTRQRTRPGWRRAGRIGLRILYWLAVLAVSVVILVVLIMLIESRDQSNVNHGGGQQQAARGP
jgi:chromate transport protein ChrA